MFEDDAAWKNHYEDWKKVLSKIKVPTKDVVYEASILQIKDRVKVITGLINDYEVNHK